MNEEKLRKLIKCPTELDTEECIKLLMELVKAKKREEIAEILYKIRNYDVSGPVSSERRILATNVADNPEFKSYLMDNMTKIREEALINDSDDFLRGGLVALSDAYKFFNTCKNLSNK